MRYPVIIPTLGNRDSLAHLVTQLSRDPRLLVVLVNTGEPHALDRMLTRGVSVFDVDREPVNIQRWWNAGLRYARHITSAPAAVLNDDVEVRDSAAVVQLADAAYGGISYLTPPWAERQTPMTGYAFGVDASFLLPNEEYRWWWGEHDLYLRAATGGYTVEPVERGADIVHLRTGYDYPDLKAGEFPEMHAWDVQLWHGTWGHLAPNYDVMAD